VGYEAGNLVEKKKTTETSLTKKDIKGGFIQGRKPDEKKVRKSAAPSGRGCLPRRGGFQREGMGSYGDDRLAENRGPSLDWPREGGWATAEGPWGGV